MSDLTARFQPYAMSLFDSRSLGGFSSRQLITFSSRRTKNRFILFLRQKCSSRRRGNWVCVPGSSLMTKAIDYAARHGSFVYNLPVRKTPARRTMCVAGEGCDGVCGESEDEDVAEEDLHSGSNDI